MVNWFRRRTPEREIAYSPQQNEITASTNSTVHSNTVYLDDAAPIDNTAWMDTDGFLGDYQRDRPEYNAVSGRELVDTPGLVQGYAYLLHDQSTTQDVGGIPGTDRLNITRGPVDGNAMDAFQEGHFAVTKAIPPGAYGPASSEPDYAQRLNLAEYQSLFGDYSTAAATDAMVSAV